jgi:hypothetical protein
VRQVLRRHRRNRGQARELRRCQRGLHALGDDQRLFGIDFAEANNVAFHHPKDAAHALARLVAGIFAAVLGQEGDVGAAQQYLLACGDRQDHGRAADAHQFASAFGGQQHGVSGHLLDAAAAKILGRRPGVGIGRRAQDAMRLSDALPLLIFAFFVSVSHRRLPSSVRNRCALAARPQSPPLQHRQHLPL